MRQRAYAKINLSLDVIRRREDGYHDLEMIMVPVNLYDTLDFQFADQMKIISNVRYLPMDKRNTIIKAVEILREEFGFRENFEIVLKKHIPTQAGLAGGSADGAAVIRALNRMLGLGMNLAKCWSWEESRRGCTVLRGQPSGKGHRDRRTAGVFPCPDAVFHLAGQAL